MFSVAYSARFIHSVFFGPPAGDLPREPHEPTRGMLAPSALLVLACLLVGIFPEQTIGPSLQLAVRSILGAAAPEFSLKIWHGFTTPLLMSVLALVGGGLMYAMAASAQSASRWQLSAVARTGRRQAGIRHGHGPDGSHVRAPDELHLLATACRRSCS